MPCVSGLTSTGCAGPFLCPAAPLHPWAASPPPELGIARRAIRHIGSSARNSPACVRFRNGLQLAAGFPGAFAPGTSRPLVPTYACGFRVAEHLRQTTPELFRQCRSLPVRLRRCGSPECSPPCTGSRTLTTGQRCGAVCTTAGLAGPLGPGLTWLGPGAGRFRLR